MQDGVALRTIPKLMGKAYKTGDTIPGDVLEQLTPQSLRALVNNRTIDVAGMEADGGGMGQHIKAKVEKQDEEIKKLRASNAVLQQANDDLAKRTTALEGVVTKLMAGSAEKPKSRREASAAAKQE